MLNISRTIIVATGVENSIGQLSNILFGICKGLGIIAALFGLVQLALSFQSHDPGQRSQAALYIAGGAILFFAQSILSAIGIA